MCKFVSEFTFEINSGEAVSLNTYEIMQGLVIPISGGTTPEESDTKQGFYEELEEEEEDNDVWASYNP